MKDTNKSVCPLCDSSKVEVRHDHTKRYLYLKKQHQLDGLEHTVCLECGCSFFMPGQIDRNRDHFLAFAKGLVKDIAPWQIREIREKYLISQEEATRIFNCGSSTQFSKWERGECAPTGTAALTLLDALEDSARMKRLADRAGVKIDIPESMGEKQSPKVIEPKTVWPYRVTSTHYTTVLTGRPGEGKDHVVVRPGVVSSTPTWNDDTFLSLPANIPLAPVAAVVAKEASKRQPHRRKHK